MYPHVRFKVASLGESLAADFTLERPLAGVRPLVDLEPPRPCIALATNKAMEWFLSCVN